MSIFNQAKYKAEVIAFRAKKETRVKNIELLEIPPLNEKKRTLKYQLGDRAYEFIKNGSLKNKDLLIFFNQITTIENEILEKRNKIAAIKSEPDPLPPIEMPDVVIVNPCPNPKCGQEVPPGSKFCPYCSLPINYCVEKKCNKPIPTDAKFCPYCNTSQLS